MNWGLRTKLCCPAN